MACKFLRFIQYHVSTTMFCEVVPAVDVVAWNLMSVGGWGGVIFEG